MTKCKAALGASINGNEVSFCVWAPEAQEIQVIYGVNSDKETTYLLSKTWDGYFIGTHSGACPGDLYNFLVDKRGPFPDPASRYQPLGVHGPSAVVDPGIFRWQDQTWHGLALDEIVIYELHVGSFTPNGTFEAIEAKLEYLLNLGITVLELMPVADFPGRWNWGYDSVAPFAPARAYGTPDDLRHLIDRAHNLGLAVFLDVVYNHFGPDGAYQGIYSPYYFTDRHSTPWGKAIRFDGVMSEQIRRYFVENAIRWITEYHVDGLRLDATATMADDSPEHILAEITREVTSCANEAGRTVHLMAEDDRNEVQLVRSTINGGFGLSAVWADDFHHQARSWLAGDKHGHFADYQGSAKALAETAKFGWFYQGQTRVSRGGVKGTDPQGIDYKHFVFCIQNHDQVGNRAFGDRLHQCVDLAAYRALSALLLLLPETPLLFMGQEWAATTPFLYFTDHHPDLGRHVTEGRQREFQHFATFADESKHTCIPDPQLERTFRASKLNWHELSDEPHSGTLQLYRDLLKWRRSITRTCGASQSPSLKIQTPDENTLSVSRGEWLILVKLRGGGQVNLPEPVHKSRTLLTTEDKTYVVNAMPIVQQSPRQFYFERPGALILYLEARDVP